MTRAVPAIWASLLAASLAGAPAMAQQIFRAGVDAVAVDVLVTRDGRPVAGLTAADFTLLDNGVPQQIDAVLVEDVPITLFLVLDTSASVRGEPLVQLRAAAEAAAAALRPEDRVGLLTFSHHVRMAVAPPADPRSLPAALRRVEAGGATALYDATFAAVALRERARGRSLLLVFSDGADTTSWLDPRDVLTAAQRSDVVVYGVTLERVTRVTRSAAQRGQALERRWFPSEPHLFGRQYLPQLVEDTGGSLFVAERTDELGDAFARVVDEFRSRYLLAYSPQRVAPGGWHAIEVTVNDRRVDVQARRGYLR